MKSNINFWPIGIIATFVLFVGGMASVVVIASTHRDSLVSSNYYEEELKFQNQIDAAARARAIGASVVQNVSSGQLIIQVPELQANGEISGTVEFYRPSASALDHALKLAPAANGSQIVDTAKLASGPWLVRVKWTAAGKSYFLEQKIIL